MSFCVYASTRTSNAEELDRSLPIVIRAFRAIDRSKIPTIYHDETAETLSCWPMIKRLARAGLIQVRLYDHHIDTVATTIPCHADYQKGIRTELDKAGRSPSKALKVLKEFHPDETLDMLETLTWPARRHGPELTGLPDEPWYTRDAITIIRAYLQPGMRVLEYGGGASTHWYAKMGARVTCIESDPIWQAMILASCPSEVFLQSPFDEFDLVAVDGAERLESARYGSGILKSGGYLLLDNSEEETFKPIHQLFAGWPKTTTSNGHWETTIWRKPWVAV